MKLLDFVLVLMPLGELFFDIFLRGDYKLSSLILMIVGIVYLCLPINTIMDFVNAENFNLEEKTYR